MSIMPELHEDYAAKVPCVVSQVLTGYLLTRRNLSHSVQHPFAASA